ncbi:hypothetical protein K2Z83_13535 [Oscillochloris sp. ZM17-4]|uniref:hypothetical protein n=1 Tax=Oscillochloris sp. ZM17-4 TaxID=2866714 RepID=UPI001C73D821|nr:hypothetical protein [Oscillochloris sp. ZM17-4]MBX0328699.1 hypothetical protein [Oscillochloris sp. ZM17-4]
MAGHNGGFNPYRDVNGEFCAPAQAGKPGRSRKGGSGGGRGKSRPPAVNITKGVYSSPFAARNNPRRIDKALYEGRTGQPAPEIGYRQKGTDRFGTSTAMKDMYTSWSPR